MRPVGGGSSSGLARFRREQADVNRWTRPLSLLVTVFIVALYAPYFYGVVVAWRSNPYAGHVLFVPALAAILLWVDRDQFRRPRFRRAAPAVTGLGIAAALLVVGYGKSALLLQTLSFGAAVAAIAWWGYGAAGLRRTGFLLAFLMLMMPPPRETVAAISPAVQHFVAIVCGGVLRVIGVPVIQDGAVLGLVGVTLEVAEECSGLRFLPILFVFVAAFARVTMRTFGQQALLIAMSIPVAVMANVTRVVITSAGTYFVAPDIATGPSHYYIGKACWLAALLVMIGVAGVLRARGEGVAITISAPSVSQAGAR